MPDRPPVPGEAAALAKMVARLRAANTRLRELLAGRDELIAGLRAQVAEAGELREQIWQPRQQVADLAARVQQNSRNSSRPLPVPDAKSAGTRGPLNVGYVA